MEDDDVTFISVYPYSGQREDIVSFQKGQLMCVSEKPSDTWWVAELDSGEVGYVPAAYLKEYSPEETEVFPASPPPIRSPPLQRCVRTKDKLTTAAAVSWVSGNPVAFPRVAQLSWEAVDLNIHDPVASEKKREAMSQLMARVGSEEDADIIRKPLEEVLIPPLEEDVIQIKSRKLSNPVIESLQHKQLHQELRLLNKRGELRNERSELDKILQARKRETDCDVRKSQNTSQANTLATGPVPMTTELFTQLQKRTQHLKEVEEELSAEQNRHEFLKIKLRKTT